MLYVERENAEKGKWEVWRKSGKQGEGRKEKTGIGKSIAVAFVSRGWYKIVEKGKTVFRKPC